MATEFADGLVLLVNAITDVMTGMGTLLQLNAAASSQATGTEAQSMATAMFAATAGPWIEEAGNIISGIGLVLQIRVAMM